MLHHLLPGIRLSRVSVCLGLKVANAVYFLQLYCQTPSPLDSSHLNVNANVNVNMSVVCCLCRMLNVVFPAEAERVCLCLYVYVSVPAFKIGKKTRSLDS